MSIGHEVGVIKLPDMAAGHGNPSVLTNQIQRYITELSAAGSMYDQFSSAIVLDGDFEWEMEFFGVTEPYKELIGSISEDNDRLCRVHAGGKLRGYFGSNYVTGNALVINDGKVHTLSGKRVGDAVAIYVDEIEDNSSSGSSFLGSMSIDALMRYGDRYADGGWLSLKIWKGGDRTTGTLVMDATKDGDGSSDLIVNAAGTPYLTRVNQTTDEVTLYTEDAGNYIGPELWELPIYAFAGTEVSGDIIQSDDILQGGATYRATFSGSGTNVGVTTGVSGSTRALIGNSSIYADANPFDVTEDVTALTVTAEWQVIGTPPFAGSCSIDSVRRLIEVA